MYKKPFLDVRFLEGSLQMSLTQVHTQVDSEGCSSEVVIVISVIASAKPLSST